MREISGILKGNDNTSSVVIYKNHTTKHFLKLSIHGCISQKLLFSNLGYKIERRHKAYEATPFLHLSSLKGPLCCQNDLDSGLKGSFDTISIIKHALLAIFMVCITLLLWFFSFLKAQFSCRNSFSSYFAFGMTFQLRRVVVSMQSFSLHAPSEVSWS